MEETGNVKALEKALCVLDAVRDADSPLGVNEIAKICGMSAATVYRMLRTMRSHGWVYQDENEKYRSDTRYPSRLSGRASDSRCARRRIT